MEFQSWGNYPRAEGAVHRFTDHGSLQQLLAQDKEYIARGNGRSYGDSSLGENLIYIRPYDCFDSFDVQSGAITVQAGILLSEILQRIVPEGWFLSVTPGTKFITVGGAIASDVHGKNHHVDNSFCRYVTELTMMLANGDIQRCSRAENEALFRATCGGMGLTGIILSATLTLRKISSARMDQTVIKTSNLDETLHAFQTHQDATYSVAWIDCLAGQDALGRGLVTIAEHSDSGTLDYEPRSGFDIPVNLPSVTLNSAVVWLFNALYYGRVRRQNTSTQVTLEQFFYPLDSIQNWNRIYGGPGFLQYQFVLPLESSRDGLQEILAHVSVSGFSPPLAVLKLFGEGNDNWLSFPMRGATLAMDFRYQRNVLDFLSELDRLVVHHGGRFYLSKDARVSAEVFESGYKRISDFRDLRQQSGMHAKFNSLQSRRLSL